MTGLLAFFLVMAAGLFFSEAFDRLHLPWVAALILAGVVIGPDVFGWVEPDGSLTLLADIGLIFLMFNAGLEVPLKSFKKSAHRVWPIALINAFVPFVVGGAVALAFGYSFPVALLIGIIFISSSIAVVIPLLEERGVLDSDLGHAVVTSTMLQDIASLVLLSIFFQSSARSIPQLIIFYGGVALLMVALRWAIPRIKLFFHHDKRDLFQQELRSVFVVLLGVVAAFELFGVHPIIAGFFGGLIMSDAIRSEALERKLRVMSYGIFIPIFFVSVGLQAQLPALFQTSSLLRLAVVVIIASVGAKVVSGFVSARIARFSKRESAVFGVASTPQLSTTLAVAFSALSLGQIDEPLVTSLVLLSLVTSFLSPLWLRSVLKRLPRRGVQEEAS